MALLRSIFFLFFLSGLFPVVHCCAKWICWILSTDHPNIEPSWAIVENELMMPSDIYVIQLVMQLLNQ